ncbi:MAG TPA: metallophosphoesterase [Pyrinomonadaceae bacterium]|nr:metallophosphoesterase [Pyrinomonadaceae bacterium]
MSSALVPIPAGSLPQFDELYVISDLHLGGPKDFQIFNSGEELKRLIDHLRGWSPERRVALVINGDFVDFLAERPSKYFDPAGAVAKLDRIATEDPTFRPAFEALRRFAATKNRHLVVNLGNHDLELALPWVRARLLEILAGTSEPARARITFAFDGAGYLCRVGEAEVICVHGNEVDDWNVADYEVIRRFGREVTQGRPVESWIPNAGSQLVIDVMNDIKARFPFVDLLKPETEGVLPILFALAPDQRDKMRAITATARRLVWDKLRRATGFLGAGEDGEVVRVELPFGGSGIRPLASGDAAASLGRPRSNGLAHTAAPERFGGREYAERLLAETEERLVRGLDPLALVGADQRGAYLGVGSAVMKWFGGAEKSEVLREALSKLREDRSFDFSTEDATFVGLDEQIGGNAEFVVAGHTHLERAMPRKRGRGWYFNSGTWARLVRIDRDVLDSADRFREVFDAFKAGTIQALDDFPELVMRRLTVVAVWDEDGRTHGELRRVSLGPAEPVFTAVEDTRFVRG